jgi:hypothetical protein
MENPCLLAGRPVENHLWQARLSPAGPDVGGQAGPELILSRGMIAGDLVATVLQECKILCRIVAASRRTARDGRQPSAPKTVQPKHCPG